MFASKSVVEHLLRGLIGIAAFVSVPFFLPSQRWWALVAMALGFVALRGCPSCWLMGLVETVALGRGKGSTCTAGSCAKRTPTKPSM